MRRMRLGRDGPEVSALCLGTMTWGRQTPEAEAHRQIDMALDHGVTFMDTAEMYPVNPIRAETVGDTERIIGAWIARGGGRGGRRDAWVIATKIAGQGSQARGGEPITAEAIGRALDASLRRLGTDRVDLYQFHWPNRGSYHFRQIWDYAPKGGREAVIDNMRDCLRAIGAAIAAGKVRAWGLSNESAWGMAAWLRLCDEAGVPRPVSVQNEYSLMCRIYDADLAELGVMEEVTLLAFSPLAAGLLTGKYQGDVIPPGSRREANPTLGGRIGPRALAAAEAYVGIARAAGLDPAQMAIAWTLTRPFPCLPIIGATTADQLAVALGAAGLALPAEVTEAIRAAQRAHPVPY